MRAAKDLLAGFFFVCEAAFAFTRALDEELFEILLSFGEIAVACSFVTTSEPGFVAKRAFDVEHALADGIVELLPGGVDPVVVEAERCIAAISSNDASPLGAES